MAKSRRPAARGARRLGGRRDQRCDMAQDRNRTRDRVTPFTGSPKFKIERRFSFRTLQTFQIASLAQAETRARIEFGGIVEIDTGVLRADIDVPKCGLKRARRANRVRTGTGEHSRTCATA